MSALPVPFPVLPQSKPRVPRGDLPDYVPARMVNEFVYCPRLYFYMWVEGLFRESADTVEGSAQHKRVDARPAALPEAGASEDKLHARSVTLSSGRLIEAMKFVSCGDFAAGNSPADLPGPHWCHWPRLNTTVICERSAP